MVDTKLRKEVVETLQINTVICQKFTAVILGLKGYFAIPMLTYFCPVKDCVNFFWLVETFNCLALDFVLICIYSVKTIY